MALARYIAVSVAGLNIVRNRISASIERPADAAQDTGAVTIFNLSRVNEQQIYDRGTRITVDAGYPGGQIGQIYNGTVQRVQRSRKNLARLTKINLGGMTYAPSVAGGFTARSYAGAVSVRSVVRDLAADMGLTVGPLDAIPATATVQDAAWSSQTTLALTQVLLGVGVTWYEDDGLLRTKAANRAQPDSLTSLVSPNTGLIGSPVETDEGIEIKMFLNPVAQRGGIIQLSSETISGTWRIAALRHAADNWDGAFTTWCDLRELVQPVVASPVRAVLQPGDFGEDPGIFA